MEKAMRRTTAHRRFTLMELLVVISIIILATAMAVPAVNKFTKGQTLQNAGRLLQSAFNEARRAAITTRRPHFLLFFSVELQNPVRRVYGVRVFQQGLRAKDGYTTDRYLLPNAIELEHETRTTPKGLYGIIKDRSSNQGCQVAIFDDCPYPGPGVSGETDERPDWITTAAFKTFFDYPGMRPKTDSDKFGWVAFRRDGTVRINSPGGKDVKAFRVTGDSLYDRNVKHDESKLDPTKITADITLRQIGEPLKRCYIDIDANTGRVRYRVVALNGYSGGGSTTTTGG